MLSAEPSTADDRARTGLVLDVLRGSLHDGPGIRTTVFLKGCPLRCVWCHNPESQAAAPVVSFRAEACTGCGACAAVCPHGVHRVAPPPEHTLDRTRCTGCGVCVAACPAGALERKGERRSAGAVFDEVAADRAYCEATGGGMTLSGGEPLAQPDFACALLRLARDAGISTAVETCGHVSWRTLEATLGLTDLYLYDCKGIDAARHRENTGADNALILENLERLIAAGARVALRCPLVPGRNDAEADLRALAAFRAALGSRVEGMEIMPYHRSGNAKAVRTGMPVRFEHADATDAEKARWLACLHASGAPDARLS